MKKYIVGHEIEAFFLLTFFFSWAIWFLAAAILPRAHDWGRVTLIASYSPSLVALLLINLRKPRNETKYNHRFWIFFPLLFIFAAVIMWLDSQWWGYPLTSVEISLDLVLASIASYTITSLILSARSGDGQYPLKLGRAKISWYILALFLWPGVVLAANTCATWSGIQVPENPSTPNINLIPLVIETLIWFFLFGGPLNEEAGWRGYALPRLQARFNPLVAGLLIGTLWGFWHLPGHITGEYPGGIFGALIRLQEIPSGIIFAWLFNRAKGNLMPVLLLHAARNTTSLFLGRAYVPVFILWFLLSLFVIFVDKMWQPLDKIPATYPNGLSDGSEKLETFASST